MFKNWSIKTQLQFLAVITLILVSLIAVMANYASSIVVDTQVEFGEELVPLANHSRQLNSALTHLINRQNAVLKANNLQQLAVHGDRLAMEEAFEQHWRQLSDEIIKSDKALADSIYGYYQDLLSLDADILNFKQQSLHIDQQLTVQNQDIEIQLGKLNQSFDSAEKIVISAGSSYAMQLIQSLKLTMLQLQVLCYQSFDLTNEQQLNQVYENEMLPLFQSVEAELAELDQQVTRYTDKQAVSLLAQEILALKQLVSGKHGLFNKQKQRAFTALLLKQTEDNVTAVIGLLNNKLEQLAELLNEHSYSSVVENAIVAEQLKWKIIIVSGLLLLVMIVFAYILIRKINQSLKVIRNGMHALSEGKFDTRLPTEKTQHEVDVLARDFNVFAESTEQLIIDFADVRQSLENQEQHLRAVLNGVPEAILTITKDGIILGANPSAENILAAAQQQLVGEDLRRFFAGEVTHLSLDEIIAMAEVGLEFDGLTFESQQISMQVSFCKVHSADDDVWVCTITDATLIKKTDQQLYQATTELNAILDNAMVGIAFIRDRKFVRVNQKFEELFLFERDEIQGRSTLCIYPNPQSYEQFGREAYSYLIQGTSYEGHVEMRRQNGELFWCALAGKVLNPDNPEEGAIWLFEDVTKQRENEERLINLASLDTLTGLPNRAVFNDRLEHAIHKAHRYSGRLAVFFLDLDHFKTINDSLGHRVGDMLLVEVSRRIKSCLREGDTVARLGGDEFTLILEDIKSAEFVGKVAEKVLNTTAKPYMLDGTEVNISPSIGISLYPADGRDLDMLIRNADAAMYHAKKNGRNNFQFYSAEMNAEAAQRLALETALRKAVENDEFYLHYQPQIDLETGQLSGAEALIRWNSTQWGEVSPAKFIPILEDTGLISAVGEWVLRRACLTYLELQDQLPSDFKMAVNLSGRQFRGGKLAEQVKLLLNDTGMPVQNLELEITESMLMDDTELAIDTLRELSKLEISLAIDDFGTGYSSLSYLKLFPLNVLKIDSTFVRDITTDQDDAAIVDAIMAMSNSLELKVVAEGVETKEQLDFLETRQCHFAQGYYFSRPLDKDSFTNFIQQPLAAQQH